VTQQAQRQVGPVGDHAVSTPVAQPPHRGWIVHGPWQHREAQPVRRFDVIAGEIGMRGRPGADAFRCHRAGDGTAEIRWLRAIPP